jgi:hypothetical protein
VFCFLVCKKKLFFRADGVLGNEVSKICQKLTTPFLAMYPGRNEKRERTFDVAARHRAAIIFDQNKTNPIEKPFVLMELWNFYWKHHHIDWIHC